MAQARRCTGYTEPWDGNTDWSPAKRLWRTIFATIVFVATYALCWVLVSAHWVALAVGWIPASIFASIGYAMPLGLLEFLFEVLSNFL